MKTVLDLLWERDSEILYISREEYMEALAGWNVESVYGPNGIAAAFVSRGPEFHFLKFDDTLQATREHLRKYPGSLIAKHGYALTRTPKDDARQRRFNQRLGFVVVGEDEFDFHLRIERSRYGS
jgi:hypothetical protein